MPSIMLLFASLALLNHLFFNLYPPSGPRVVGPILALEPFLLSFICAGDCSMLQLYVVFFATLSLSICAYRLSPFHPLACVPGPTLGKISKLYDTWIVYTGRRHTERDLMHKKYGPMVRIAPNEISIADVDAIKPVLGSLPKGPFYTVRTPSKEASLLLITGDQHAQRRGRWMRGFSTQALKEYEEVLIRRIYELIDQLEARCENPIDFAAWMNFFVLDFLDDMAFGGGSDMMSDPNAHNDPFWKMLEGYASSMTTMCQLPWAFDFLQRLSFISKDMQGLVTFGMQKSAERIKRGTKSKDLWSYFMDEENTKDTKPPLKEVIRDGILAVIAGTDTTSAVMTSLFYSLLLDADCYKRLQKEIDAVLPSSNGVQGVLSFNLLPYTMACINETLRLYPPTPTSGPREVPIGDGNKLILGNVIPEGTQIYVPSHSLHRDPRYFWPSPDAFRPDRWLITRPGDILNRDAFIPFSFGFANCVGKQLALQEMLMVTVLLLQRFDIAFAPGFDADQWPKDVCDYYITTRPPLKVVFNKRH